MRPRLCLAPFLRARLFWQVPSGTVLEYGSPEFVAAEDAGMRVFKDCAFVLVAGGLGERLGYTDIKLKLPVETTTGRSYIQLYVQQILAMQVRRAAWRDLSGLPVSFLVAASDEQ